MTWVSSYISASGLLSLSYFPLGDQPDIIDVWMEKATAINNICKHFFTVKNRFLIFATMQSICCFVQACDKLTYINNRELLYDLNSYINNVRIILHACNNYLKVS